MGAIADAVTRGARAAEPAARRALGPAAIRLAGPAARVVRRRWQWRTCGADLDLATAPSRDFPHAVAEHATPMLRDLPGVDRRLQLNKVTNLGLATARLDTVVIEPGQRLSFWRLVGAPTARRGYLDGLVLDHGQVRTGVGGGLCQLTNLLYWMTIHTQLTVVERWRHSYDVFPDHHRTLPFASGATCSYPALDLQVENRTTARFQLRVRPGADDLEGQWRSDTEPSRSYRVYQAAHLITHEQAGVYLRHNLLRRRVYDPHGAQIDDEMVAENHARMMYEPILGTGTVPPALGPPPT